MKQEAEIQARYFSRFRPDALAASVKQECGISVAILPQDSQDAQRRRLHVVKQHPPEVGGWAGRCTTSCSAGTKHKTILEGTVCCSATIPIGSMLNLLAIKHGGADNTKRHVSKRTPTFCQIKPSAKDPEQISFLYKLAFGTCCFNKVVRACPELGCLATEQPALSGSWTTSATACLPFGASLNQYLMS